MQCPQVYQFFSLTSLKTARPTKGANGGFTLYTYLLRVSTQHLFYQPATNAGLTQQPLCPQL